MKMTISNSSFCALVISLALLMGKASAGVEEHFGVGFSTKFMSNPPSNDTVINSIIPQLKDTLGISKFRMYNAIIDAEYVADLVFGNKETKFIVDIGFIWYNETEQIGINDLTQDDVNRYITRYVDTVGDIVKAKNGEDYEWLDNVETIGYVNEPYVKYFHWWNEIWETLEDAAYGLNRLNRIVQSFFNEYMDGKYKTQITIAPIFIGEPVENFTTIMLEESIKLQYEAGAPISVYSNDYACHPIVLSGLVPFEMLAACIGLPGQGQAITNGTSNVLEARVMQWKHLFESLDIPVDSSVVGFVITETGWPTSGFDLGSEYVAGSYYNSVIRLMNNASNVMHDVDVYFFEAMDEDLKPNLAETQSRGGTPLGFNVWKRYHKEFDHGKLAMAVQFFG